jgi:uncharacterized membrane protein (DUF2068 family)
MSSEVDAKIAAVESESGANLQVLRAVATFELTKGLIVLLAAGGIVLLMHREDPWDVADGLLHLLHISPDHHFAQAFLEWADALTESKVWTVAAVAGAYSILRFAEAYGLWYARTWAEWMALISGALYLPFEIYKVIYHPSLFHASILVINLAVVSYMIYALKTGAGFHGVRQHT